MTSPLPVAVVGGGNMGSNHIRVYEDMPEAELVEVVEPDSQRAAEIRAEYGVSVLDDVTEISEAAAATVATPNRLHVSVAESLLESGLGVLVEKPLAPTVEEAERIVAAADANDGVLQVGHIEQFNPAVQTLRDILDSEEVIAIEAHRLGPFNESLSKEHVVHDLMIHDLDIIDSLVDSSLRHVEAIGTRPRSVSCDHASAQLLYESNVMATATASHVTHGKIRRLDVTTENAFITLNYQTQDITLQHRGSEQTTALLDQSGYRTETVTESPYVRTREPLKLELEHFVECVLEDREPLVSGQQGARAVSLATDISDCVDAH